MNDSLKALEASLEIARKYIQDEDRQPVNPYMSPAALANSLNIPIGTKQMAEEEFLKDLEQVVMATPKTASKSFFNQLFGGRNNPALMGEILAAVMNNSMYTFKVAGAQVLVEREVCRKMIEKIGYSQGEGTITSGGSISNMVAMMIARNEKEPLLRNHGSDGRRFIAYTSADGHYSTRKNAGILGLGREHVRAIVTDREGCMIPEALEVAIQEDQSQGLTPFFVNATAGTTVLGAFDPFEKIGPIAQKYGLWFHIDGAFGGSALLSDQHRYLLRGSEQSDSFTWNAHKMMGVPLTASVALFRHPGLLRKHFSEKAEYLFQGEDDFNPGEESLQCGRRNDALKIWAAWKYWGDVGYEARINRQYALARYAADCIREDPTLELVREPSCVTVCFRVKDSPSEEICQLLNQQALIKVGFGRIDKKSAIRMVCVDPDMNELDIDNFFQKVRKVALELR